MDPQDKTRFEIHGKSSVKYHLKANHVVEAKRWFWTLNNAIQWAKDEAKEEERRQNQDAEALRQAKLDQSEGRGLEPSGETKGLAPPSLELPNSSGSKLSKYTSRTTAESGLGDEEGSIYDPFEQGGPQSDVRVASHGPDGEEDDYGDYASSREVPAGDKDALNITAQSAKIQLELLANVASSLQTEKSNNPEMTISDPAVEQALAAYDAAVSSLKSLVQNLLRISRDRDSYWRYRLGREAHLRNMWEESMARVAQEHEELQSKMGESEEKRRRTKKALKEALEGASANHTRLAAGVSPQVQVTSEGETPVDAGAQQARAEENAEELPGHIEEDPKKGTRSQVCSLYESDDDEEDEFFDALDAGEIEAEDLTKSEEKEEKEQPSDANGELRAVKYREIQPSFKGYEEPIRKRLKMDYDNRPRISLWVSRPSGTSVKHKQKI